MSTHSLYIVHIPIGTPTNAEGFDHSLLCQVIWNHKCLASTVNIRIPGEIRFCDLIRRSSSNFGRVVACSQLLQE